MIQTMTHDGFTRSRKMGMLNTEGDKYLEEARWLWKMEWNELFSVGENREGASGPTLGLCPKKGT